MPRSTPCSAVTVWARYATISLRSSPPIDCKVHLARKVRQIIVIPKGSNPVTFAAQFAVSRLRQPIGGLAAFRQGDLIGLIVDQPMRREGHAAPIKHDESGTVVSREARYLPVI